MNHELDTELFQRSQRVAPGGVHSPVRSFKGLGRPPIFFESSQGASMTSVSGRSYIDFCQSFGPLILGHRPPEVQEEVLRQIDRAWTFGAAETASLELAEWITSRLPHVEKLRFVSSGTEAVMSALRVARAATGRQKIAKFEGCYHGHVDSMLVKSGSGLAGEAESSSLGVGPTAASETLVIPLHDPEKASELIQQHGQEIAALILEPLPANYGLMVPDFQVLKKILSLFRANQSLIIFDEVITGFRTGLGGMAEVLDFSPDLVTYGKIIGGGFPVGCYGGSNDLMEMVAPLGRVYQAGTLSANPVGMRAGLKTLEICERDDVWATLQNRMRNFRKSQNEKWRKKNYPLQMISFHSLFWIRPYTEEPCRAVSDLPENISSSFEPLFSRLLQEGVYLSPNAFEVGFLGAAHSDALMDEFQSHLDRTLQGIYG